MFLVFSCHRSSITLSRCRCHEAKKCRVPSSCTVLCYRYLECGSGGSSGLVTACLERLTCITHDRKIKLPARDREVAAMLVSFTIFQSLKFFIRCCFKYCTNLFMITIKIANIRKSKKYHTHSEKMYITKNYGK